MNNTPIHRNMKATFIIILIFLSGTLYAQNTTKKYNKIMNQWEYYDSSGRMIGVQKWNSIMQQWEYYEEKNPTSTYKQVTPYQSPYDIGAIEQALRYKQEQHDRAVRQEQAKQEQLITAINNNIKLLMEGYKNESGNYPVSVQNGWHTVYAFAPNELFGERKVYVENNRIKYYIVDNWAYRTVTTSPAITSGMSTIKLKESGNLNIYIMFLSYIQNRHSSSAPPEPSGSVSFWTNFKGNPIDIWVEGEYIGRLDSYFKQGTPNCGQNGTLIYNNKRGFYKYYAKDGKHVWQGTISITANKCTLQGFIKK